MLIDTGDDSMMISGSNKFEDDLEALNADSDFTSKLHQLINLIELVVFAEDEFTYYKDKVFITIRYNELLVEK